MTGLALGVVLLGVPLLGVPLLEADAILSLLVVRFMEATALGAGFEETIGIGGLF